MRLRELIATKCLLSNQVNGSWWFSSAKFHSARLVALDRLRESQLDDSTLQQASQHNKRHAGMDCRHPGPQDASGHVPVNLGFGNPCRNDDIERLLATLKSN